MVKEKQIKLVEKEKQAIYDIEILPYEIVTAFEHDALDRWLWLYNLRTSPRLLRANCWFIRNYKYSVVQDAYYALLGRKPVTGSVGSDQWESITSDPQFALLRQGLPAGDTLAWTTAVFYLASIFTNTYLIPNRDVVDLDWLSDMAERLDAQIAGEMEEEGEKGGKGEGELIRPFSPSPFPPFHPSPPLKTPPSPDPAVFKRNGRVRVDLDVSVILGTIEQLQTMSGLFRSPESGVQSQDSGLRTYDKSLTGHDPREVNRVIEDFTDFAGIQHLAKILGRAGFSMMESFHKTHLPNRVGDMIAFGSLNAGTRTVDRFLFVNQHPLGISRYVEGRMLNHGIREMPTPERGPVYIFSDESESMDGKTGRMTPTQRFKLTHPLGPSQMQRKDEQAKTFEVAIAALLAKSGRNTIGVAWDAKMTRFFDYGSGDIAAFRHYMSQFYGGGTAIVHVLKKWLPKVKDKSDIFIISDGAIADDPTDDSEVMDMIHEFRGKGGKIWLMYVGFNPDYTVTWPDITLKVEDLVNSETLKQVFVKLGQDPFFTVDQRV